jgi:4-hydroxybenzoate polyprenyltransferase
MNVVKYQKSNDTVGFNKPVIASKILAAKRFVIDEFVHGGHLLSLGSSAVALSTMLLLGTTIRWEFLLIVYFGTYCIYNYDHYKGLNIDSLNNSNRSNHLKKYNKIIPVIIIIYAIGFFSLLIEFGNFQSFIFGGALLFSGLFYTSKVKKMTEKIVGFKNFYTSVSIASLVFFTGIYCSIPFGLVVLLLFVFLFLRFMVNTCFCDIKDVDADKKYGIKTFPVILGKEKFLSVLHVINVVSFIPLLIGVYLRILSLFSLFLIVSIVYSFYYIQKAKQKETDIQSLSSIVVDGEFAFWPFILFMGSSLIPF